MDLSRDAQNAMLLGGALLIAYWWRDIARVTGNVVTATTSVAYVTDTDGNNVAVNLENPTARDIEVARAYVAANSWRRYLPPFTVDPLLITFENMIRTWESHGASGSW